MRARLHRTTYYTFKIPVESSSTSTDSTFADSLFFPIMIPLYHSARAFVPIRDKRIERRGKKHGKSLGKSKMRRFSSQTSSLHSRQINTYAACTCTCVYVRYWGHSVRMSASEPFVSSIPGTILIFEFFSYAISNVLSNEWNSLKKKLLLCVEIKFCLKVWGIFLENYCLGI